jgi:hypothetical protein
MFGLLINYFGIEQNIAEVEIEYLYQASVLCSLIIERNKIERENFCYLKYLVKQMI